MAITGPTGIQPNVRITGETPTTTAGAEHVTTARSEATPSMATAQMQRTVDPGATSQLHLPPTAMSREASGQRDAAPDSDFRAAMAPLAKLLNNPALKTGMAAPGAAAFLAGIPTLGAIASAAYALWHFARFVGLLMAKGKLKWSELAKAGGHTAAALASAAGAPLASTIAFLADAATTDDEEWTEEDGQARKKREPTIAPVPEPMA
ncbi:MAG: hypothetical protein ACAI38_01950 [Myxococcota bacterium]|nr:hypothetical protein [Myxococcota bacterium]